MRFGDLPLRILDSVQGPGICAEALYELGRVSPSQSAFRFFRSVGRLEEPRRDQRRVYCSPTGDKGPTRTPDVKRGNMPFGTRLARGRVTNVPNRKVVLD
jgi:hypothetical protein